MGNVEQVLGFDPWGMRLNVGDNAVTDRGYTGHEMDDETGLINMNARVYIKYGQPLLDTRRRGIRVTFDNKRVAKQNAYGFARFNELQPDGRIEIVLSNSITSGLFRSIVAEEIFHASELSTRTLLSPPGDGIGPRLPTKRSIAGAEVRAHDFVLANRALIGFDRGRRDQLRDIRREWNQCFTKGTGPQCRN